MKKGPGRKKRGEIGDRNEETGLTGTRRQERAEFVSPPPASCDRESGCSSNLQTDSMPWASPIACFQSYPSYLHTACIPCIASLTTGSSLVWSLVSVLGVLSPQQQGKKQKQFEGHDAAPRHLASSDNLQEYYLPVTRPSQGGVSALSGTIQRYSRRTPV